MSLTNNIGNVRANLKIDPQKKVWSDSDLTRFINQGQRWLINQANIDWEFGESIGYLIPVSNYQEYRTSTDDLPETFFSSNIRKLLNAKSSNGNLINFSDFVNYNSSNSTAPSIISQYANRFFLNAGYSTGATYTTLHNCDTYDGNGTWAGTNDATTIATDITTFKEGTGSVSFSIDVSNSTSNKATLTNSTLTPVTISDSIDDGGIILWVYLTSATNIKSIEVLFGTDSSNYYGVKGYEKDVQGIKYKTGWNRIFLPSRNKLTVGSPVAIGYLQVNIEFDSSEVDQASCRIDNIQFVDKYIEYFYTRQSTDLVNASDESVVPSQYQYIYETYAESKALGIVPGMEQKSAIRFEEAKIYKNEMIDELMYNLPRNFEMPPR